MDEQQVAATLAEEREATLARIATMTAELEDVAAAAAGDNIDDEHDPEGTTVAFEREQLAALRTQAQNHLADVDAALQRLAAGRYGLCEQCGQPIGEERLAALPAVRLCITCASRSRH